MNRARVGDSVLAIDWSVGVRIVVMRDQASSSVCWKSSRAMSSASISGVPS